MDVVPVEMDDNTILDKMREKDSVMQCVRNWIVELGELDATFRKSDIASLKSFITSCVTLDLSSAAIASRILSSLLMTQAKQPSMAAMIVTRLAMSIVMFM